MKRHDFPNECQANAASLTLGGEERYEYLLSQVLQHSRARLPEWPNVVSVARLMISPELPRLYDIPLVTSRLLSIGRGEDTLTNNNFSAEPDNEGHNILINVCAATLFGYAPQQAVGKTIQLRLQLRGNPAADYIRREILAAKSLLRRPGSSSSSPVIKTPFSAPTQTWRVRSSKSPTPQRLKTICGARLQPLAKRFKFHSCNIVKGQRIF